MRLIFIRTFFNALNLANTLREQRFLPFLASLKRLIQLRSLTVTVSHLDGIPSDFIIIIVISRDSEHHVPLVPTTNVVIR